MKTMKVVKVPFEFGGEPKNLGDQIEVQDHVARRLESKGVAAPVAPAAPTKKLSPQS